FFIGMPRIWYLVGATAEEKVFRGWAAGLGAQSASYLPSKRQKCVAWMEEPELHSSHRDETAMNPVQLRWGAHARWTTHRLRSWLAGRRFISLVREVAVFAVDGDAEGAKEVHVVFRELGAILRALRGVSVLAFFDFVDADGGLEH